MLSCAGIAALACATLQAAGRWKADYSLMLSSWMTGHMHMEATLAPKVRCSWTALPQIAHQLHHLLRLSAMPLWLEVSVPLQLPGMKQTQVWPQQPAQRCSPPYNTRCSSRKQLGSYGSDALPNEQQHAPPLPASSITATSVYTEPN